ncbi:MAG: glucosyltransferase [Actinomycetales bacterium]|nr:MAG: glucosyltransferase [Actinomycetales bacterium]
MRIVVTNNFFPPRVGGSSHLSNALAQGYAARGHEVLVVTAAYQDAPALEERDGLRIVRMPAVMLPETRFSVSFDISFATRPGLPRALRTILDDFGPDVIHQHGQFFDLTWASGAYARKRRVPTLLSVHTRLENPAALYRRGFRALDAVVVAPQLRRYRPDVVVMDVYMQDYITTRYAGAYGRLHAIPVGVDPDWVRGGDRSAGRLSVGLADQPIILSVGHVIPVRDRLAVVEALPAILQAHPEAKLLVVGRIYYPAFLTRAEQLGVRHAIVTTGAVPKARIPDLMAAADVECHEQGGGLGTATLEAMAAGVPVVAHGREDNFPRIRLVDGGNIYLAPVGDVGGLADRLVRALDDPAGSGEIARQGQELVQDHFALDRVLDAHLEVFEQLIAQEPARPR